MSSNGPERHTCPPTGISPPRPEKRERREGQGRAIARRPACVRGGKRRPGSCQYEAEGNVGQQVELVVAWQPPWHSLAMSDHAQRDLQRTRKWRPSAWSV
eukprot:3475825-Rhodomonas_salina.2